MTTVARASGPRLRVLRALHENPVVDRSGRAVHLLCQAARFDRQDALAQVLARMDHEGLIRREVQGRRTYRIEITETGRQLAGLPGATAAIPGSRPARLRFESLPPGPASTWHSDGSVVEHDEVDPVVEVAPVQATTHSLPERRTIPAALRELVGSAEAEIDYEVLAGVLLQTVLRTIRNSESDRSSVTPSQQAAAEARIAALTEELAAARGRLFDLEAQVRILERNNRTLAEQNSRSDLRSGESLSPGQRELAHLMVQKPTARG